MPRRGSFRRGMRHANENRRIDAMMRRADEQKQVYWETRRSDIYGKNLSAKVKEEYLRTYEASYWKRWQDFDKARHVRAWESDKERWEKADEYTKLRHDPPPDLGTFLLAQYERDRDIDMLQSYKRIVETVKPDVDNLAASEYLKERLTASESVGWIIMAILAAIFLLAVAMK